MQNWFTRTYHRWSEEDRTRREAERLTRLPPYLLRDMGLTPEGAAAVARQLRSGRRR